MRKYLCASAVTMALVLVLMTPAEAFELPADVLVGVLMGFAFWMGPSLGVAYGMGKLSQEPASRLRTATNLLICSAWTAFFSFAVQLVWAGVLEYGETDHLFSPQPLFHLAATATDSPAFSPSQNAKRTLNGDHGLPINNTPQTSGCCTHHLNSPMW